MPYDLGQGNTNPGNDHRPGFDAAHAVDVLFEIEGLHKVVEVEGAGFLRVSCDLNRPGSGSESLRIPVGLVFSLAEFVEIVVRGYVLEAVRCLVGTKRAIGNVGELREPTVGNDRTQNAR